MAKDTDLHDLHDLNDVNDVSNEKKSPEGQDASFIRALWVLFSSMKTAIVLLLLLATVSILGTVILQNATPGEYVRIYGETKYNLYKNLGLTDVYHSGWYRMLLLLVSVNLTVCSLNRFKKVWKQVKRPKILMSSSQISKMQKAESLESRVSVEETAESTTTTLRQRRYSVARENDGNDIALYAAKGTWSLWGPYFTHISILIIFIGAIFGNMLGFEGYVSIVEGETTDIYERGGSEHNHGDLGFKLKLNDFRIIHDKRRSPTGYKSDLSVFEGDKQVKQKVIDVNHPLTYKGVSFFQSDYGLIGFVIKVMNSKGEVQRASFDLETRNSPVGKQYIIAGESFKEVKFKDKKLTVFAHDFIPDYLGSPEASRGFIPLNPAATVMVNERFPEYKGLDGWTTLGWLEVSKSEKYKDYTIEMEDAISYSGLRVARNPGLPIVYIGFILMMIGVALSFYVNRKVVRVRISPAKQGSNVVVGGMCRSDAAFLDHDLTRIRSVLSKDE